MTKLGAKYTFTLPVYRQRWAFGFVTVFRPNAVKFRRAGIPRPQHDAIAQEFVQANLRAYCLRMPTNYCRFSRIAVSRTNRVSCTIRNRSRHQCGEEPPGLDRRFSVADNRRRRAGICGELVSTASAEKQVPLPHRIAAGAVIVHQGKILLVRYLDGVGGSYLVSPGGGVEENESLAEATVRETLEETGVTVTVRRLLAIEDLICSRFRMCKFWFLGAYVSGEARPTEEAAREGITQAAWFSRDELAHVTVYPSIICANDWASFESPGWIVEVMEPRRTNF
jgi:8-oxo-dGTP diphosphatase